MSRRQHRSRSSWASLAGATVRGKRTDRVDRASVVGSAPIIAGMGFLLSRIVAIAVTDASGLTFLWGLVIGLAFATTGVAVLISTENDARSRKLGARRTERIPFATAGGVLVLSLLTGVVLGAIL